MSNFLGDLSGLMKGLSGFMPQDDPEVRLMTAQSELSALKEQETELYAQIGRLALAKGGGQFPELENRLQLVQGNIIEAAEKLKKAQTEKDAKDAAQKAEEEAHTCSSCGSINPDGMRFCQECGAKLGALKCRKCGVTLSPGTRFCGECGAKQEG